jgi:hypothetical protein
MRGLNNLDANDLAEKSDAFGGDRDAVYRAVSAGELDRNAMSSIASLRHAGYDTAGRMALTNHGLQLNGNAQLQDIINARRSARYQDIGALLDSGGMQQTQQQREYDLPMDRLRFRQEMLGPLQQAPISGGGDQVGAAMAGYQDGYNTVSGLTTGWNTQPNSGWGATQTSRRAVGMDMYT